MSHEIYRASPVPLKVEDLLVYLNQELPRIENHLAAVDITITPQTHELWQVFGGWGVSLNATSTASAQTVVQMPTDANYPQTVKLGIGAALDETTATQVAHIVLEGFFRGYSGLAASSVPDCIVDLSATFSAGTTPEKILADLTSTIDGQSILQVRVKRIPNAESTAPITVYGVIVEYEADQP